MPLILAKKMEDVLMKTKSKTERKFKNLVLLLGVLVMLAIIGPLFIVSMHNNVGSNRTKVKVGEYFEYENEIEFRKVNNESEILDNASRCF